MSKTQSIIQQLETEVHDKIKFVLAFMDTSECPESDKQDLIIALDRIATVTAKPVKSWENQVKKNLDAVGGDFTDQSNGYHYWYKLTNRKAFDTTKARSTLESLDYHIDDFYSVSESKSLQFEKISQD